MSLKGNWEGYYEYGEGYILPYFGERVKIEVELYGDESSFTGLVTEEDSKFSVPLQGEIKGFLENELVSFIKTYDGNPTIREDQHNSLVIEKGTLEIEHQGYYDEKNQSMYGSWIFEQQQEDEEGKYDAVMTGTWLLKKMK